MLAIGLLGQSCLMGSRVEFAVHTCFTSKPAVCKCAVCFQCHSCLLSAFASSPPFLSLATISIWVVRLSQLTLSV